MYYPEEEGSMDFDQEDSQQYNTQSTEAQTQSTQAASQPVEELDVHLWGALMPCNTQLLRIDFWKMNPKYCVGRNPTGNQVVFPGPKISNYHCEIVWDLSESRESVVTVLDKSSNGTFINGTKLGKNCTGILREGNEIAFGTTVQQADGDQDYRFIYRHMAAGQPTTGLYAHYDLSHELGKGSFATVMKAIERSTGKWFAVKIINDKHNRPGDRGGGRNTFTREISIMKKLKHPNICELKEVFYQDNGINLVLELIEGGDLLEHILRQGGLDEYSGKHITYQICDALAYIHAQGVAHRDLKPENVLLTKDTPPIVKVADFGLAKAVHSETMLRTMCGTPTYLAPEVVTQRAGEGYTNRVDSWSVGVIVFSMLTNASPFIEDEAQRDIRIRILERRVDWTTLMNVGVSPQAEAFIRRLLDEDPTRRMSLTESLKHPWLSSYTPIYDFSNLKAYDTISSLDPHDFSMIGSSIPGYNPNASVTTNFHGLQLGGGMNPQQGGNNNRSLQRRAQVLSQAEVGETDIPEPSWEMLANAQDGKDDDDESDNDYEGAPTPTVASGSKTGQKRLRAELTPQREEDEDMREEGMGKMSRGKGRMQQPAVIEQEDSFDVPGLTSSRRTRPPNKQARRK